METAPTSIEVILRPIQSQSDEPSDLRGFLSPTSVYSTWQSQAVTHPIMNRARRCLTSVIEHKPLSERCIPYQILGDTDSGCGGLVAFYQMKLAVDPQVGAREEENITMVDRRGCGALWLTAVPGMYASRVRAPLIPRGVFREISNCVSLLNVTRPPR